MASARAVGSLRQSICQRLMHQRDIRLEPVDLELRYADLTGDIFKAPNFTSSMQLIEEYRPEWRLRQIYFFDQLPICSWQYPTVYSAIIVSQSSPRW